MDSRDWFFEPPTAPHSTTPLPPPSSSSDLFTLPANISTSSLFQTPLPDNLLPLIPRTDDAVSDLTDVALLASPHPPPTKPATPIPALSLGHARISKPDDSSRRRHNQMMRENRGRFNHKFQMLVSLLEELSTHEADKKPLKNKIQILDRAMLEFARLQQTRARAKHRLLFAPGRKEAVNQVDMEVLMAGGGSMAVRELCAACEWKYGEVWEKGDAGMWLMAGAFVGPNNMPETRRRLMEFGKRGGAKGLDKWLQRMAGFGSAVWVPDVGNVEGGGDRVREMVQIGITTTMVVPVGKDMVWVILHAEDELGGGWDGGVRPYDAESLKRANELARAMEKVRDGRM